MKKIATLLIGIALTLSASAQLTRTELISFINNRLTLENSEDRLTLDDLKTIFAQLVNDVYNIADDDLLGDLAIDTLQISDIFVENNYLYIVQGSDTLNVRVKLNDYLMNNGATRYIYIEPAEPSDEGDNLVIKAGDNYEGEGGGDLILMGGGFYTHADVRIGSDSEYAESAIHANDSLHMHGYKISHLAPAVADSDAVNKAQVYEILEVYDWNLEEEDPVFASDSANLVHFDELDYFTNTDETDQVFTAHLANDITAADTTRWGAAESDPVFGAWDKSTGIEISTSQISDYDEVGKKNFSIRLPSSTTVDGRIFGTIEGDDYPTGWVLEAGTNPVDLKITHGTGNRVINVTVFSVNGTEERQLFGNAAYSGILTESVNILRIESLATIQKTIKIYIIFE